MTTTRTAQRATAPMMPPALFASRTFAVGNAAIFLTFASLFSAVFFIAQFLQTGLGHDPLGAGLRLLPWTATLFFVAPVAGLLIDRIGERPFLVSGLVLQATGTAWLALIAEPGMAYGALIPPFMVSGVGLSLAIPAAQSAVVGAATHALMGKAAGANSTLRELGGVLGIAVAVAVFAGTGGYGGPIAFTDGFAWAIGASAAFGLVGAVTSAWLPARRAPSSVEVAPRAAIVALDGSAS